MSSAPTPPNLESLGERPFSFYHAIIGIEHNEWRFRKFVWSEACVVNVKSGNEIWIPRRYLGEASKVEEPVAIVGLVRELEYKGGSVWPHTRRVIEMPAPGPPIVAGEKPPAPAPVMHIRTETPAERRVLKLIGAALLVCVVGYLIMANVLRQGALRPRVVYTTKDQSYLELKARDDYYAVIAKLGQPGRDRWFSETGEIQYRALSYPQRSYTVILMGTDRKSAAYIGTLDDNWHPVHAVPFRTGGNTFSVLRGLQRF